MSTIKEIAEQTIGRIFGEAAFIFTDKLDQSAQPEPDSWDADGVSLQFKGTPSGEMRMWVSAGFACYAAANMLGVDPGSDEARIKGLDALKELLNIIVGNFITQAYGTALVFDLGIPRALDHAELAADSTHVNSLWLEAEDNCILFVVRVD